MLTSGERLRRPHLDIFWIATTAGHSRLGLIVSKARETGVARNRLRRRLKELWRRETRKQVPSWDVVFRTRPAAYRATFAALRADLEAWREAVAG